MNDVAHATTGIDCGNCGAVSPGGGQFCVGCGQPLWQKCSGCGTLSLLKQNFCNGCGSNLAEALSERLGKIDDMLARARTLADNGKFEDAIRLAQNATEAPDYRFKPHAEKAQQLCRNFAEQQSSWSKEIDALRERATRYVSADRHKDIVRILGRLPNGSLPEDLAEILSRSQYLVNAYDSAKAELMEAVAAKKYDEAIGHVSQMIELRPGEAKYQKQLDQLVAKVLKKSAGYRARLDYRKAVTYLQSIPLNYHDDSFRSTMDACEEVLFLREALANSTFANPLMPVMLRRLAQQTPDDPNIGKLQKLEKDTRQQATRLQAEIWPEWRKGGDGLLGTAIVPTRIPAAFPSAKSECLSKKGAQFFVAIGLAIQAASVRLPHGDFLRASKAKGVLGILGGKKSKASEFGWGIDIGDSSVKAVRIRFTGDSAPPQIDFATIIPFPFSASRRKVSKEAIDDAIQKLISEVSIGDERVIINFPGNDLISRHLLLPPDADRKKFDDFVMQEARANIPIAMDLLHTAYLISDPKDAGFGKPSASVVAARKQEIEFRKALVENAGLRVDGVLPEPFALCNTLETLRAIDGAELGEEKAELLIDVGSDRTAVVLRARYGVWHRTIDWGMSEVNAAMVSALKLTQQEADQLRREPHKCTHLKAVIEAMKPACQVAQREVQRSVTSARDAIGDFQLDRAMLIGGGAYQPFLSNWINGSEY